MSVAGNLDEVRGLIAAAARRAGRDPAAVRLVAISKTHPAALVAEAAAAGQLDFGENRVQEAREKIPLAPPGLAWHLVGHLQTNKAREAARLFDWVHSLDSLDLARQLDRRAGEAGRRINVLVEVKLSPEESKNGVPPELVEELLRELAGLSHLESRGLMTMPPLVAAGEEARPWFRELARLRLHLAERLGLERFDQLSMGMSGDFAAAIEEGATMVRVGTAIFGQRHAG